MPSAFILRLSEFLAEESFSDALTEFLDEHTPELKVTIMTEEQDLNAYSVYNKFTAMIEAQLEVFREREALSEEQFRDLCASDMSEDEASDQFIQALVASWSYDAFMELALGYKLASDDDEDDEEADEDDEDEDEDEDEGEANGKGAHGGES